LSKDADNVGVAPLTEELSMSAENKKSLLAEPLPDLSAWVAYFRDAEIPVQADSAEALEALRSNEDDVDANTIGEVISNDPLLTLKVLAFASKNRPATRVTDTETVIAALVMMGISPFFRAFGPQPTLENRLQESPEAVDGLRHVLRRSHRAANFALAFAVHRMDHDVAMIHQAALLHDFAEMLLWAFAPSLALRIRVAQLADSTLRSSVVQQSTLNIELSDLQQSLMKVWCLPDLLIQITDDKHADHPSVKSVLLAMRLARHTQQGWENAALPDDVNDIAQLLNLSQAATLSFVRDVER
jgi:HD-like signal output (HDOD) protein